ncbi:hypothetical protein CS018_004225 [Escherichia coli]|nr:hypothetical protein [Escherichia coli]
MSLVNFLGSRAMSLTPAFIQNVQRVATSTGHACIKVNGQKYGVSYVDTLGGFCVQPAGKGGLLGRLLGNHRGLEGRVAALELVLNKNQNPIKAHNEYMNKIFESRI